MTDNVIPLPVCPHDRTRDLHHPSGPRWVCERCEQVLDKLPEP